MSQALPSSSRVPRVIRLCWQDGAWRWQRLPSNQPTSVVIGQLDGVHRGHQALLQQAASYGLPVTVLTFDPPPRAFFQATSVRISNLRSKLAWLKAAGVHQVYLLRFNRKLASLDAEAFVTICLRDLCQAKHVVVGSDFLYGHRRQGNVQTLIADGERHGIRVHVVNDVVSNIDHVADDDEDSDAVGGIIPAEQHPQTRIASTGIRTLLQTGELEQAMALLGHPLIYAGRVIHGKQLGRTLGYPTLNLRLFRRHRNHQGEWHHPRSALTGVLLVKIRGLADHKNEPKDDQAYWGIASLGHRPTVNASTDALLEVFVLDWEGNAYGRCVEVEVIAWRRHEQRFDSLDALKQAMAADLAWARGWGSNSHTKPQH